MSTATSGTVTLCGTAFSKKVLRQAVLSVLGYDSAPVLQLHGGQDIMSGATKTVSIASRLAGFDSTQHSDRYPLADQGATEFLAETQVDVSRNSTALCSQLLGD
jgi:hypothetical protein